MTNVVHELNAKLSNLGFTPHLVEGELAWYTSDKHTVLQDVRTQLCKLGFLPTKIRDFVTPIERNSFVDIDTPSRKVTEHVDAREEQWKRQGITVVLSSEDYIEVARTTDKKIWVYIHVAETVGGIGVITSENEPVLTNREYFGVKSDKD
jgi:hypothetical protein